jgi:NADH-quinone oxidoreductase subunit L
MANQLIALCAIFLPLLSALVIGLNLRRMQGNLPGIFGSVMMLGSAICGLYLTYDVCLRGEIFEVPLLAFIHTRPLSITWSLYFDSLSALMVGIVTFVSCMVHIYSIGYMNGESGRGRFTAYMNLFTFAMLILVTAPNFLQLFVGWEGVGVCSYLLIGFYYKRERACTAAQKAFIVNRVSDIGFILGMALALLFFGSLNFNIINTKAALHEGHMISLGVLGEWAVLPLICALFFWAAMGKSAQFGLHVWLPDAMEGPTPVSALIHAATMVTAGVFLLCRISPLLQYAAHLKTLIFYMGGLTAFIAATIACVQMDIKRVIAYSTCSQLGYMFMAIGAGAFDAAMFHLTTHAFFKSLLFLGAGSVIHMCSGAQNMSEMGGLWRLAPWTYTFMLIGSFSLSGIPFFAGYYSKDAILNFAWFSRTGISIPYILGIGGAFLTAFYSMRLLLLTFHGPMRENHLVAARIQETSWVMRFPMFVLSLGALFSGYLFVRPFLSPQNFWGQSLSSGPYLSDIDKMTFLIKSIPTLLSLSGFVFAYLLYEKQSFLNKAIPRMWKPFYTLLINKWYIDELYTILWIRPFQWFSYFCWKTIDVGFIDNGIIRRFRTLTLSLGSLMNRLQTGRLTDYIVIVGGAILAYLLSMLFIIRSPL